MSAVATKTRGTRREECQATLPVLATTAAQGMQDIRAALNQVEVLVDGARNIGDSGDHGDRLMRLGINVVLPDLLETLQPDAYTESSVSEALNVMYDLEAAVMGAEAMHRGDARGTLLGLALSILDDLSNHMDRFKFWPQESPVPAGSAESTMQGAASLPIHRAAHIDETHDPYSVMLQAQAVAEIAATEAATDVHWAIHSLVEKSTEKTEKAQRALQSGRISIELHEAASNELAGVVGMLRALNNDAVDDVLLYALETLLVLAKAQIDADYEAHRRGTE